MMITGAQIVAVRKRAAHCFEQLQSLYGCLPETRCVCERPGVCCAFLPEMTVIEALQWIDRVMALALAEKQQMLARFVTFYLTNPIRHNGCPFMTEGMCTIYPYRTFACRAYGLWSRSAGRKKTRENRDQKRKLCAAWQRYGVALPEDRVVYEIDYCTDVRIVSGPQPTDRDLMDLLARIYDLGEGFGDLQARFETAYHSDVSFLITALLLGYKRAVLGKFAVIKQLAATGTSDRLERMIDRIDARRFADDGL